MNKNKHLKLYKNIYIIDQNKIIYIFKNNLNHSKNLINELSLQKNLKIKK